MLQHRRDLLKFFGIALPVMGSALTLADKPLPPLRLRYFFQCNEYFHHIYSRYPAANASAQLQELRRRPLFTETHPHSPVRSIYKWELRQNGWLTYLTHRSINPGSN